MMIRQIASFLLLLGTTTAASTSRPSFVSHVTQQDVLEALEVAKQHHVKSVREALEHYPIDLTLEISVSEPSIPLTRYRVQAPGSLPDFASELPRDIYVTTNPLLYPLLSSQECQDVIHHANAHFQATTEDGAWTQLPSGQYMVAGFWIKDIPAVQEWFLKTVRQRLFPLLQQTFPDFVKSPDDLCVDNAYLFKYHPDTGGRTDVHTDSGCLSFTMALNPATDYVGGGTWFDGLCTVDETTNEATALDHPVIEMKEAGQVTIRPGGVKHCGFAVESGVRYIIGGFCMHQRKPEPVRQVMAAAQQSGQLAKWIPHLEAAIVLSPEFDSAYNLLAAALEEVDNGSVAKRIQILEYCLEQVHPYAGDASYALGSIYKDLDQVQDLTKARACFEKCLQADTHDVEAMVALMMLAASTGDQELETQYAHRVIDSGVAPQKSLAQAYCNLGVLAAGADEEIGYYLKALALAPTRFAPRYSLACAYATRHEWELACESFVQALELPDPSDVTPQQKWQTLQNLYKATAIRVQAEVQAGSLANNRDAMMTRFQDIMKKQHFDELLALKDTMAVS